MLYKGESKAELESKVRQLEDDLFMAQHAILEPLPEDAQSILRGYGGVKTKHERKQWISDAVEAIIEPADTTQVSTFER